MYEQHLLENLIFNHLTPQSGPKTHDYEDVIVTV